MAFLWVIAEASSNAIPGNWNPHGTCYRIELLPQLDDANVEPDDMPFKVEIVFAHTEKYPEEVPLIKARSSRGLSDADIGLLQNLIDEQAEENLGMPMIFTLITAAQEWLDEKASSEAVPGMDPEAELKREREAEEARIAELRAHGTPVTAETFAEWKARFDAEMRLAETNINSSVSSSKKANQMTGKEWFMQDKTFEEPALEEGEEGWSGSDIDDESDFDEDEDDLLEQMLKDREPTTV